MPVNDAFGRSTLGRSNARWKIAPADPTDEEIKAQREEQAELLALSTRLGANDTVLDLTKY